MDTLLLDTGTWDLVVDSSGNIAVASAPYALAQDAASAIRTFQSEVYYNTILGVDYDIILGKLPPLALLKSQLVDAALTVPGVVAAQCFITGLAGRRLTGQVQVTDTAGRITSASF